MRNWEEEQRHATSKYMELCELTIRAAAELAQKAVKEGSPDPRKLGNEGETFFNAMTAVLMAGSAAIGVAAAASKKAEALQVKLDSYEKLDKMDASQPDATVIGQADEFLKKVMKH